MGAMALCGALCYGELAARFPEAGGGYVYLREAFGPTVAFLYGWMALAVMDPGLTAALAVGLSSYVSNIQPLSPVMMKVVAIGPIFFLASINILGVRIGGSFIRWLTLLKMLLLLGVLVWGFASQRGDWANFTPLVAQRPGSAPFIGALAGGLVAAFFSFGGWWDLNKVAGEVRDPSHTLPRALVIGVSVLTLVYILTTAVFIYLVPLDQVTSGETFAAQVGEVLFGGAGGRLFSAIVVIAVFGSLGAVIMSAPRVYFAMARDGLFVPWAAALHPRFATPARAILIQAGLASILVLIGTFNTIISYFIFVVVVFLALTVAGLFVLKKGRREDVQYKTPGFPVTPIIFLVLIVVLLVLLGSNNPLQAFAGVAVVALGLPVYYLVFRRRYSR